MDINKLCKGCFKELPQAGMVCPYCGFSEEEYEASRSVEQLPVNTILDGSFIVGRCIKRDYRGFLYIGLNINLNTVVTIRELYPAGIAIRDTSRSKGYQSNFIYLTDASYQNIFQSLIQNILKEAQVLGKLDLPSVPRVSHFFAENQTVYLVANYTRAEDLKNYLMARGGKIPEKKTLELIHPVIETLRELHNANIFLCSISPETILAGQADGNLILESGSLSQGIERQNSGKSLALVLEQGYSPMEIYSATGIQGPWTDIYGLCATMYTMLTGSVPDDPIVRLQNKRDKEEFLAELRRNKVSPATCSALIKGMAVRAEDRFQNMSELEEALFSKENPGWFRNLIQKFKLNIADPKDKSGRFGLIAAAGALTVLLLIIISGVAISRLNNKNKTLGGKEDVTEINIQSTQETQKAPETESEKKSKKESEAESVKASEEASEAESIKASEAEAEAESVKASEEASEAESIKASEAEAEAKSVKASEEASEAESIKASEKASEAESIKVSEEASEKESIKASEKASEAESIKASEEESEKESIRESEAEAAKAENKAAYLITGSAINEKMKELAGSTARTFSTDASIEIIDISKNPVPTRVNVVNIARQNSEPVWMGYIPSKKTIRLYTDAEKIILDEDSSYLFSRLEVLQDVDLTLFDSSNVKNMEGMFTFCRNIKRLDLSGFDTSNVITTKSMFYACKNLEEIDLSSFDTGNVRSMSLMFGFCSNLQYLDLSGFDTSNVTRISEIFHRCTKLKDINSEDPGLLKQLSLVKGTGGSKSETETTGKTDASETETISSAAAVSGLSEEVISGMIYRQKVRVVGTTVDDEMGYFMIQNDTDYSIKNIHILVIAWDKKGNIIEYVLPDGTKTPLTNYSMNGLVIISGGFERDWGMEKENELSGFAALVSSYDSEDGSSWNNPVERDWAELYINNHDIRTRTAYKDRGTIKKVQEALNKAGYDCGTPDGLLGKKTFAAINAYQNDHDLIVTGDILEELKSSLRID